MIQNQLLSTLVLATSMMVTYCHGIEMRQAISGDSSHQCPPWFIYHPTTNQCECYNSPSTSHIIICTKKGALLRLGYCMTYERGERIFVSPCNYRIVI